MFNTLQCRPANIVIEKKNALIILMDVVQIYSYRFRFRLNSVTLSINLTGYGVRLIFNFLLESGIRLAKR